MANKTVRSITAEVRGIPYAVFAQVKWSTFLRWASLAVALLALGALGLYAAGRLPHTASLTTLAVAAVLVAGVLVLYRQSIKNAYRASGLGAMELRYTFDRDGWTVRRGREQVRVLWSKTHRVRRTDRALLLYPNRQSVNLLPLRYLSKEELEQIIRWVQGKK